MRDSIRCFVSRNLKENLTADILLVLLFVIEDDDENEDDKKRKANVKRRCSADAPLLHR